MSRHIPHQSLIYPIGPFYTLFKRLADVGFSHVVTLLLPMSFKRHAELRLWTEKHLQDDFTIVALGGSLNFIFKSKDDALMFKLIWG